LLIERAFSLGDGLGAIFLRSASGEAELAGTCSAIVFSTLAAVLFTAQTLVACLDPNRTTEAP
jgi:hypothetical protein